MCLYHLSKLGLPSKTFSHPKYFGWENVFDGRPSLERWYKHMSTEDACAKKIKMEVMGGLMAWDESDRYEKNGLVAAVANDSFQWSY
jgi:hypothetical protein